MKKIIALGLLRILRKQKINYFNELMHSQWLSPGEIKEIQNIKFLRLVEHCKKNIPYYYKLNILDRIKCVDDIIQMPTLTKKNISENIEELKATNFPSGYFKPNSTSGSTGASMKFYSDAKNDINVCLAMRNSMWTGWDIGERQAILWGSHFDISMAQKISYKIRNLVLHRNLYLSSFDMKEDDMLGYRQRINKYKPALLTGYPSGLFTFANFLEKKGLEIIQLKGIICSGETLYEYQREKIESAFHCRVFNRYGCRETASIACECEEHDGLHINAEHVIVEFLNEDGAPCKAGEVGEMAITDLDNYAFPFIRYRIGDIGLSGEGTCRCGRGLPLIKRVEGRVFDVVVGMNNNYITGNFWTILMRTHIRGVSQFQVVQEARNIIVLKLVTDDDFKTEYKETLLRLVHEKCGEDMKVNLEFTDKIPLTGAGKQKFVISKVSPFAR
ncbi:MAG: phenylacetate--CoA ligase family protein [Nitrospirae bacterium]|nr:phenylacetate--CoA ligase family protein [Nitrospirota bacterium]